MSNEDIHNEKWNDDSIQFPRLITEIRANVDISNKEWDDMCNSMDLSYGKIEQLFNRADKEWEKIKEESRKEQNDHCQTKL